ncbi:hypothetical protein [Cellulophaga baltica]|uniref:Uncharacterized protein n=1 Tax=Cellulophaga baltica TaxID=76594 RepID=A0A1G7D907_9FLAO|nr:hypothetical protein [Cellulophaga baltica]SDE47396.1 hypothetical protein SAMN04487992_101388 [Cellulophaga baltica]
MNDINTIYYNDFGIAFQWKRNLGKDFKKVQLVFKDTGMYLTSGELMHFSSKVDDTLDNLCLCYDCQNKETCKAYLLQTPLGQLSFALTYAELEKIKDLITGTIFQLRLDTMLKNQSIDFD